MKQSESWFFVLCVILALLVRILWLDSDPPILLSYGNIGDEGLWTHNARLRVLFGERTIDDFSHDYAVAPLFSWIVEASFRLFGVSFFAARLPSALFGFLTTLIAFDFVRRISRGIKRNLALLIVSVHTPLLVHQRLAVGESLTIFFLTLSWWVLVYGQKRMHYLCGGMILGFAILAKFTSIQYLGVFILLILMAWFVEKHHTKAIYFFLGLFVVGVFTALYSWSEWKNIQLIHSTFSRWYALSASPSLIQAFSHVMNHPFWGSPFMIGIVWGAVTASAQVTKMGIVRGLHYVREENPLVISSFVWLVVGVPPLLLGANHPSTRFYPLVLPLTVLFLINRQHKGTSVYYCVLIRLLALGIFAVGSAKFVLALARRTVISTELREQLFILVALVILIVCVAVVHKIPALRNRVDRMAGTFVRISGIFILVSILVQHMLGLAGTYTLMYKYALVVAICLAVLAARRILTSNTILLLSIAASLIGLHILFAQPSFTIKQSGLQLGELALTKEYTTGFLSHELSLQNVIYPIYWGPRQQFVSTFNEQYARTLPTVILVPEYLEAPVPVVNTWPGLHDFPDRSAKKIGTLQWHRRWWKMERTVRLSVYRFKN